MNNTKYVLNNVSKIYDVNNEKHIILDNISLSINSDDITVILGKSGCGKTTLLRLLANLESVTSGNIDFFKDNVKTIPRSSIVFQESRLMPWLNVKDNIGFQSEDGYVSLIKKIKSIFSNNMKEQLKKYDEKIDKYISLMKLEKFKYSYPTELSGGMAQRVAIARSLFFNPSVLLMDEPFSALDYFTRMDMQNEVIRIHNETKVGVIFVTHDIDEALRLGNRLIVFTHDSKIKDFIINEDFNRDSTCSFYGDLKKKILDILKD